MFGSDSQDKEVTGAFVSIAGERYYAINNVDQMPPFFISVVSDNDHWMFISSNGGLTAGRVSPEIPLFPYVTVDKIHDSSHHTGSKTLLRLEREGEKYQWEPFNREHDQRYQLTRNLYKSSLGNKLLFEEINHDLQLAFRYQWLSSDSYGFVRDVELENLGAGECQVEVLDGVQNVLPAGTPRFTQTNSSNLVDAYKWSELEPGSGLAFFTLFSAITDRAEPAESLRATTVFSLGLDNARVLLSDEQVERFRRGLPVEQESIKRGIRGAYLLSASFDVQAGASRHWQVVANTEQSQVDSASLLRQLQDPETLSAAISESVDSGTDALARILAASDGFQLTGEENVSTHHTANVLFNVLRGGIFDNQYQLSSAHFSRHVRMFNSEVYKRHQSVLEALPAQLDRAQLAATLAQQDDPQLGRLAYEYLPITFGRRHGDPSRPWNQFAIRLTGEHGERMLSYEGNWRDIFQNWEALLLSFPEYTENMIAKFVNASTVDGYNPYRITDEGIDWEVEDPEDPWSYIGYWGDHQIIYLQKLLELCQQFYPARLGELLHEPLYCYANVPYRIKPLDSILENPKSTIVYDDELAERIEQRVATLGADGKLLLDGNGQVYQVNLLEKLLVPLLSKLGNLVVDGGIWLNTQRPEWNDANNALVGQGLSMVTLYYLRRYMTFMQAMLEGQHGTVMLSAEIGDWLREMAASLARLRADLGEGPIDAAQRKHYLLELGGAASRCREIVYQQEALGGAVSESMETITGLLDDALVAIDHSIGENRGEDGLYHAYNLLNLQNNALEIAHLYPMLEGQVAALSSGAIAPRAAAEVLEALFDSDVFRLDQNSFLLYPDRDLPGYMQKNCLPADRVEAVPLLAQMLQNGDGRLVERDASGVYRFNADLSNADDLKARLETLASECGQEVEAAREPLLDLYEEVFNHRAFTGRSGGMFGFEGLGSIYWHMVSKLLLAAQENFFAARDQETDEDSGQLLGSLYYRIRGGIGFNKSPEEYGAFPLDPYSHTPAHSGAQQPGMTGQVKEEMLTRFGELGIRVKDGAARFDPSLLRQREFCATPHSFRFLDVAGQWGEVAVPAAGLAFTWCQVPIVYRLDDAAEPSICVDWHSADQRVLNSLTLPAEIAGQLFRRDGHIRKIEVVMPGYLLFAEE